MRHLVTGGAGFIGSHLCEELLYEGGEVICFDNLFTSRMRNIEHLVGHKGFEFVRGDVCSPFHFEVDRIWNLACPASPVHYQRNAVRTIKTSVLGTLNALELARETGARLLIASTSEIYGDPEQHPQKEGYWGNVNPIGPRACYDEGKRAAEALATSFHRQYGTDVKIARIFNCYGPRMAENDGRVVSNFVVQALRGRPMTVYGDGSQTRSFVYISDMVDGLMRLMEHGPTATPINLGNPQEFTVLELAKLIGRRFDCSMIQEKPLPIDDPTRRCPDISRAKQFLGWEPTVNLDEGLNKTIEYFRTIV